MAPAVGIAVAPGPMITLPDDVSGQVRAGPPGAEDVEGTGSSRGGDSVRSTSSRQDPSPWPGWSSTEPRPWWSSWWPVWSTPSPTARSPSCSACTSSCRCRDRRCWSVWCGGQPHSTSPGTPSGSSPGRRVHRIVLVGLAVEVAVVVVLRNWIAGQLSLAGGGSGASVVLILTAAGIWILLSVDRGLLQARRRYRSLAGNLLVEGACAPPWWWDWWPSGSASPATPSGSSPARSSPASMPDGWPAGRGPCPGRPRPPARLPGRSSMREPTANRPGAS